MMSNVPHYDAAVEVVRVNNKATVVILQEKLKIGYRKASALMDAMQFHGVVRKNDNGKMEVVPQSTGENK